MNLNIVLYVLIFSLVVDANGVEFDFSLPDLVLVYDEHQREIQIEAFGSKRNEQILNDPTQLASKKAQLKWTSLGRPNLVKKNGLSPDSSQSQSRKIFQFNDYGFSTNVETLTESHQKMLVDLILSQYGINVSREQISHLPVSYSECRITVGEEVIYGNVNELNNHPMRVDFHAPIGSKSRDLFERQLDQRGASDTPPLDCEVYSYHTERNTVESTRINFTSSMEQRLFGQRSSVYLTQTQLSRLSDEIYQDAIVAADYELTKLDFEMMFIKQFTLKACSGEPELIDVEKVSHLLSRSNFDWEKLNKIFKIEERGDKFVLETNYSNENDTSDMDEIVTVRPLIQFVDDNKDTWFEENISPQEQLDQLNRFGERLIEWTRLENQKVVAKSIRVVNCLKKFLNDGLRIAGLVRSVSILDYYRRFSLYP